MVSLLHEAENKFRSLSVSDLEKLNNNNNGDSKKIDPDEFDSLKRKQRLSSKDITASLIEDELKSALNTSRMSEPSRPTFPIASAVGKRTDLFYFFLLVFLLF
jgi:hypothetical protein